jgi:hypothetical protein
MSPPESIRNASSIYSASKVRPVADDDDASESESPFLPKRSTTIDDSFDIVFETSNKKNDTRFDESTSGDNLRKLFFSSSQTAVTDELACCKFIGLV